MTAKTDRHMNKTLINSAIALSFLTCAGIQAQSSSGNIVGDAKQGDRIIVTGPENGFHRELAIARDGKYQIRRVPTGNYTVVKVKADGTQEPAQGIVVQIGSSARVR